MSPFEYLSVLISIVLALGMARVLAGVGEMLQASSHRQIHWVHVLWIVNLFLYLVVAWWIFYRWRNPAAVDVFSVRLCPYLANDLVPSIGATVSPGRRCRSYCQSTRRIITQIIAPFPSSSLYL